jgi:hypothetical protein
MNNTGGNFAITAPNCVLPWKTSTLGPNALVFSTTDDPNYVFDILKKTPCVRYFDISPDAHLNTRFTRTLSQQEKAEWQNTSAIPYNLRNRFQELEIGGHGQVVSIADTGVDTKLCWFKDPDQDIFYEDGAALDHPKIL